MSQLDKVLTKIAVEPCRMILVTPNWPGSKWMRILDTVAIKQSFVPPETPLYKGDSQKKTLPPPPWETMVSLIDTKWNKPNASELDPKMVKYIKKMSKEWGQADLMAAVHGYPRFATPETMEKEIQSDLVLVPDLPDVSPIKARPQVEEPISHQEVLLENMLLVDVQFSHVDHKVAEIKMVTLDMGD